MDLTNRRIGSVDALCSQELASNGGDTLSASLPAPNVAEPPRERLPFARVDPRSQPTASAPRP